MEVPPLKSFKPIQMKKLFFTIALLVALNSAAQNRFTKAFQQADSAFAQQTDSLMKEMNAKNILFDSLKPKNQPNE